MEGEIRVTVSFGNISFSFSTDSKGSNFQSSLDSIEKLASKYKVQLEKLGAKTATIQETIRPALSAEIRVLKDLSIPTEIMDELLQQRNKLSNWDILILLLHYAPDGLTSKETRALSAELGKPISYSWFDTEFHRKSNEDLVVGRIVSGRKEKCYFLSEVGKRRALSLISGFTKK